MDRSGAIVTEIAAELAAARGASKCHGCGCFLDAVAALERSELAPALEPALSAAREVFADRGYDCLGCEVCWPANALNLGGSLVELPGAACCATAAVEPTGGWPSLPGEYEVLRYTAPVAVCTLHSRELVGSLRQAAPAGLSIVGAMQTENLGIERAVENVVANPNIRFLLLCGEDTSGRVGHFPGQSFLAFAENGIDDAGQIEGARGKRPVLKNSRRETLDHFRRHVEVIDARGLNDVPEIVARVTRCATDDPGPAPVAPGVARSVPVQRAEDPGPLELDPAGYLVVLPDRRRRLLVVECYGNDGVLRAIVEGADAGTLAATVARRGFVTRTDHAAYLGRELTLAETALKTGRPYVQGGAPDE